MASTFLEYILRLLRFQLHNILSDLAKNTFDPISDPDEVRVPVDLTPGHVPEIGLVDGLGLGEPVGGLGRPGDQGTVGLGPVERLVPDGRRHALQTHPKTASAVRV